MNVLSCRAVLADSERSRRTRVRHGLVGEIPGLDVVETGGPDGLVRSLEDGHFDLTVVHHPLPAGKDLPLALKERWPDSVLLLYAPVRGERALARAVEAAGDGYFLDSGTDLPGLSIALRLALARIRPGGQGDGHAQRLRADCLAAVIGASPIGVSLSTLADGRIFHANDRFLELIGREREDVVGRTATELGLWVGLPECHIVQMLADAGRLRRAEVLFRAASGEVRQGLLSVERLRPHRADALLSMLEDVTDLRRATAQRDRFAESERGARAEAGRALRELRDAHERLDSLRRRLIELQEAERRALARELHDEVGGVLAGLQIQLDAVRTSLPDEVRSLLGELSSRVRDLAMDLRPPMLDELGLVPTLLWHFGRYRAQTGIRVDFEQSAPIGRLPSPVETAAFRIVQEALTNVARHAGVDEAKVRLDARADRIEVRVEDRGAGFRPESAWTAASSGLTGMRDRARLAGGRLVVASAPGSGTRLRAELPRSPADGRKG
jgi:PAS domain S-box-containing protein